MRASESIPTRALAEAVASLVPAAERDAALSEREREAAERLGGRLHAELSGLLRLLPAESRTASGLARYLGIERTVCQRMVAALQHGSGSGDGSGAELLTRLPGVRSLRAMLGGFKERGVDAERVGSALAAVDVLAEFFDRVGGGQAVFGRRLLMSKPADGAGASRVVDGGGREAQASALYEAARGIVGRWSRVQLQVALYRPDPDRAGMMQAARLRGFLGHRAREGALPLVMFNQRLALSGDSVGAGAFEAIPDPERSGGASFAVPSLCRGPVGRLTSRRVPGGMVQIVDPEEGADSESYDFVAADHSASSSPLPTVEEPALHEVWASIDYPCEHLLFDVWQHREMARQCIPSLSTHVYRLNLMATAGERWYTRLGTHDRLELLGTGLEQADSALWDRHRESLLWMFERLGWDPDEYVGYRCAVAKPLWRTGYLLSFDFSGSGTRTDR